MTDWPTLILALWGALIGTLTAGWTIYRDVLDRGRLRLRVTIGNVWQGGIKDEQYTAWFTITNVGRRPVIVTTVGGQYARTRRFLITSNDLPKRLEPGEQVMVTTKDFADFGSVQWLGAWDSLDDIYKVRPKELRVFKKMLAESLTESNRKRLK